MKITPEKWVEITDGVQFHARKTIDPENKKTIYQAIINGHVVGDCNTEQEALDIAKEILTTIWGYRLLRRLGFGIFHIVNERHRGPYS